MWTGAPRGPARWPAGLSVVPPRSASRHAVGSKARRPAQDRCCRRPGPAVPTRRGLSGPAGSGRGGPVVSSLQPPPPPVPPSDLEPPRRRDPGAQGFGRTKRLPLGIQGRHSAAGQQPCTRAGALGPQCHRVACRSGNVRGLGGPSGRGPVPACCVQSGDAVLRLAASFPEGPMEPHSLCASGSAVGVRRAPGPGGAGAVLDGAGQRPPSAAHCHSVTTRPW